MTVRPAKTQISLGICPVWSESSLCAQWVAKDPSFLHADSEDSDQTGRMPRLIWVFAERTVILLVLSWGVSNGSFRAAHTCTSIILEYPTPEFLATSWEKKRHFLPVGMGFYDGPKLKLRGTLKAVPFFCPIWKRPIPSPTLLCVIKTKIYLVHYVEYGQQWDQSRQSLCFLSFLSSQNHPLYPVSTYRSQSQNYSSLQEKIKTCSNIYKIINNEVLLSEWLQVLLSLCNRYQ